MLKSLEIVSTSLVSHQDLQRIELKYHVSKSCHLFLTVKVNKKTVVKGHDVAFTSGKGFTFIMLPVQENNVNAEWTFFDLDEKEIYSCTSEWKTPREWTLYFMISSHTDIGLHNSQYVQRANSEKFIEQAIELTEQTRDGSVDEREVSSVNRNGFYAYRIDGYKFKFGKEKKITPSLDKPLPIGSFYTGLVDKPKAVSGEKDGQIYLLWGKNREKNLSHYQLFRSENPDFKANNKTFIANVLPEPYVVGRYSDEGLKINTRYYYKVRAVNKNGVKGDLSETFSAKTKQHLE